MYAIDGSGLFASVLLGLSAITCGTLVSARRHLPARPRGGEPVASASPLPFSLSRAPLVSGLLDVAAEAREVLQQMAAEAAGNLVHLEYAVQTDLSVHADRLALQTVLGKLVGNAVRRAPCGRVLLSAMRHGGRVQIAVSDDGTATDAAIQQAALRDMSELVALQGGTIEVEAQTGAGTTVLVRLPQQLGTERVLKPQPVDRSATSARPVQEVVA